MIGSSSCVPLLPLENPEKFITLEMEKLYHESLYNKAFLAEPGFPNSNVYFNFTTHDKGWTKFCENPLPRIAPVVKEFHSNLRYRIGTIVYVRGKWVNF